MSRTRNPTDAEDATQTAFMHALNGLRRGVVPQFELTWLLKIAENVCHSMHRRAYRRYERDELPVDLASRQDDLGPHRTLRRTLRRARVAPGQPAPGDAAARVAWALVQRNRRRARGLARCRRNDALPCTPIARQAARVARSVPVPALGRFAQWIAGPAGAKAAAVAVVTIGTATAVVSSAPAEAPLLARAESAPVTTPAVTHAVRVATTPGVRAPGARPLLRSSRASAPPKSRPSPRRRAGLTSSRPHRSRPSPSSRRSRLRPCCRFLQRRSIRPR